MVVSHKPITSRIR